MLRCLVLFTAAAVACGAQSWKFAVSGDSRNCGDAVMPAIAQGVQQSGARFYWHLGDFRALYEYDEDMRSPNPALNISDYFDRAWPDFIDKQLKPFGALPVYLAIGNHETVPPHGRDGYLAQFADWLTTDPIRTQRLLDNPSDHKLRAYYHWIQNSIDFITLDNASPDQFDDAQVEWLKGVLHRAEISPGVTTVVVGMHAALPGSAGDSHSMSNWAQGAKSGTAVYQLLWDLHARSKKRVYLLASHSHFFMDKVFETPTWQEHAQVLPGWIVGTAGAVRYPLPENSNTARQALTGVYGFLVGTVDADGAIQFDFKQLKLSDLLNAKARTEPEDLIRWCFAKNKGY